MGYPILCPGCKLEGINRMVDPMLVNVYRKSEKNNRRLKGDEKMWSVKFAMLQLPFYVSTDTTITKRTCPSCGSLGFSNRIDPPETRRCCNPQCAIIFCDVCGDFFHPKESCTEIMSKREKQTLENEKSMELISNISKPCPKCGTNIQHFKQHGCHHIICPGCDAQFCYSCGQNWLPISLHVGCSLMCDENCVYCNVCTVCEKGKPCDKCKGGCIICLI
jgi:hypothetical protein